MAEKKTLTFVLLYLLVISHDAHLLQPGKTVFCKIPVSSSSCLWYCLQEFLFCFVFFVRDFDCQLDSGVCGVLSALSLSLSLSLSPVSLSLWGVFFSLWMVEWHLCFCQLLLFDPFWIEILARKSFCWSCKLLACSWSEEAASTVITIPYRFLCNRTDDAPSHWNVGNQSREYSRGSRRRSIPSLRLSVVLSRFLCLFCVSRSVLCLLGGARW
jgi:hypothetical protein